MNSTDIALKSAGLIAAASAFVFLAAIVIGLL